MDELEKAKNDKNWWMCGFVALAFLLTLCYTNSSHAQEYNQPYQRYHQTEERNMLLREQNQINRNRVHKDIMRDTNRYWRQKKLDRDAASRSWATTPNPWD